MARNEYKENYGVLEQWTERLPDGQVINPTVSDASDSYFALVRPDVIPRVADSKGWRDPTPWRVARQEQRHWFGHVAQYDPWGSGYYYHIRGSMSGVLNGFVENNPYPSINMINRAEVNALLKAKNEKVNWSMMFVGSLPSVRTLADGAIRLSKAYRYVKKLDIKRAAQALGVPQPNKKGKDAASNWLALQYGWAPLLNDIYDTYNAVTTAFKDYPPRFGVDSVIMEKLEYPIPPSPFGVYNRHYKRTKGKNYRLVKVNLDYEVDIQALRDASLAGLENPLYVAWDLVPFSFLADWIVPVGDWLQACSATTGLRFLGGTRTIVQSTDVTGFLTAAMPHRVFDSAYAYRSYQMDRTVYSGSPIPLPYMKNPFSSAHALNAVALVRSMK